MAIKKFYFLRLSNLPLRVFLTPSPLLKKFSIRKLYKYKIEVINMKNMYEKARNYVAEIKKHLTDPKATEIARGLKEKLVSSGIPILDDTGYTLCIKIN